MAVFSEEGISKEEEEEAAYMLLRQVRYSDLVH
jgi:hypothetical protein